MSEDMLVHHCSPTMAGLKTGSLFTCRMENPAAVIQNMRQYNTQLVPCGLRLLPLRYGKDRVLVYMYRPHRLAADLSHSLAQKILLEKKYPVGDADRCVAELRKRLNGQADFPHEIGLFLGYPPEDVDGFIKNEARCAKCVGTWKVYGDEAPAQRKFAQYKKCTQIYCARYQAQNSLEQLIVKES